GIRDLYVTGVQTCALPICIWDCVIASPMGDQKSALAVNSSGDEVAGTMTGANGSIDIENGKTDGDQVSWTMNVTSPMPVTLDCRSEERRVGRECRDRWATA